MKKKDSYYSNFERDRFDDTNEKAKELINSSTSIANQDEKNNVKNKLNKDLSNLMIAVFNVIKDLKNF